MPPSLIWGVNTLFLLDAGLDIFVPSRYRTCASLALRLVSFALGISLAR